VRIEISELNLLERREMADRLRAIGGSAVSLIDPDDDGDPILSAASLAPGSIVPLGESSHLNVISGGLVTVTWACESAQNAAAANPLDK
jgi:hypothetical protein